MSAAIGRAAAADRIYREATDLILANGLDSLDINTLAERLNCSRATVYRLAHCGDGSHGR